MNRIEINVKTGEQVLTPLTPEEVADAQARTAAEAAPTKDKIDRQRDDALNAGFTHDGILWHCDNAFQSQIQGFVLAFAAGVLPPAATITIRSKANTNHSLTQAQVIALAAALMAHVQGIYAASWAAKDAL